MQCQVIEKKQSNMKNVCVKNTFLKNSNVNTTTALSTYSTPHPLSTSQKNEIYCFDSLNYCLQHWAAVWFVNYCWQWLLNWYVVIELLDVACSFVSFFYIFFQVMFLEWNVIMYVYWTRDVVTEQFAFIRLIKKTELLWCVAKICVKVGIC